MLPSNKALVVAHDWIELGMAEHTGISNPVAFVVHGNYDYYYNLAGLHEQVINKFIAINPVIFHNLQKLLPARKEDVVQCYFPVPEQSPGQIGTASQLRIVFIAGNIHDKNKNLQLVLQIIHSLPASDFIFTIVGMKDKDVEIAAQYKTSVHFTGFISDNALNKVLQAQDCFILPSFNEGLPVSLVECMKRGIVPLVSYWGGGADELVIEGETGFRFEPENAVGYADRLQKLQVDRDMLRQVSLNARKRADLLFNPQKNLEKFHQVWRSCQVRKPSQIRKVYGSRLDKPWLPNFLVAAIRNCNRMKSKIK